LLVDGPQQTHAREREQKGTSEGKNLKKARMFV